MGTVAYGWLARVHWPARERVIRELVQRHFLGDLANRGCMPRLLDVGCGPAWLAETAADLGAAYLGVDPDPPRGMAQVREGRASDVEGLLEPRDLVVINGVAHHLDDAELSKVLTSAQGGVGLVVCDHALDASTPLRSRVLQSLDRGRHVRPLAFFDRLHGWTRMETRRFPIRIGGVPAWDYFASAYRPERAA
jgi:SAM-dependent methyltransferase